MVRIARNTAALRRHADYLIARREYMYGQLHVSGDPRIVRWHENAPPSLLLGGAFGGILVSFAARAGLGGPYGLNLLEGDGSGEPVCVLGDGVESGVADAESPGFVIEPSVGEAEVVGEGDAEAVGEAEAAGEGEAEAVGEAEAAGEGEAAGVVVAGVGVGEGVGLAVSSDLFASASASASSSVGS